MRKIAVTGATGFVGTYLVNKLAEEGNQILLLVREEKKAEKYFKEILPKIKICKTGNLHEMTAVFTEEKVELVIHLATNYITEAKPEEINGLIESNITFGVQILEAMKAAKVRKFINLSSSWQHYRNQPFCPVNLYAATKQAFEDILHYYTDAEDISAVTLEICDTYGAADQRGKLLNYWKKISATGEHMDLSPGEQKLNYVYVKDIVNGILTAVRLLERLPEGTGTYNRKYALSSDEIYTLRETADIFEQVYRTRLNITWGGKPYRSREVMEPYRGTERLPGWNAEYRLKDGFANMLEEDNRMGANENGK